MQGTTPTVNEKKRNSNTSTDSISINQLQIKNIKTIKNSILSVQTIKHIHDSNNSITIDNNENHIQS